MKTDVIVGLQLGDEGKGKLTAHLIKERNYTKSIRFNGGPNAGHTIWVDGVKYETHGLPSATLFGIPSLIGPQCLVNPEKLLKEIEDYKKRGLDVGSVLKIAYNTHIIQSFHIREDEVKDFVGSTKQGMGPAFRSKYDRKGTMAEDVPELSKYIVDPIDFFEDTDYVLGEGAQGLGLDINWGDYPFVTSNHVQMQSIFLNGIPVRSINEVIGVSKIYETYVGTKEFQGQGEDETFDKLTDVGEEFGVTTGRKRQTNWLNINELIRSIKINEVDWLVVNKCDVIDEVGVFKAYFNDKLYEWESLSELKTFIVAIIRDFFPEKKLKIDFSGDKEVI